MSIESKAKTRKDLQVFTIEKGHWIEPYSILDNQLKEKYISLEDAQKEIEKALDDQAKAIHKDWNRAGREWHKEENELKAKIEAANKILADFQLELFNTGEAKVDGSDYYTFDIDQTIKALKDALLILRKEEGKCPPECNCFETSEKECPKRKENITP
jgi:hypothetical protein